MAARELGPRRDAVAGPKPALVATRFDDACAKLMAKELQRRFVLEPAFHPVVGQGGDALRELGLGDARLNAERLNKHVIRTADRVGDLVQPHVAKTLKTPGLHR